MYLELPQNLKINHLTYGTSDTNTWKTDDIWVASARYALWEKKKLTPSLNYEGYENKDCFKKLN